MKPLLRRLVFWLLDLELVHEAIGSPENENYREHKLVRLRKPDAFGG